MPLLVHTKMMILLVWDEITHQQVSKKKIIPGDSTMQPGLKLLEILTVVSVSRHTNCSLVSAFSFSQNHLFI